MLYPEVYSEKFLGKQVKLTASAYKLESKTCLKLVVSKLTDLFAGIHSNSPSKTPLILDGHF